MAARTSTSAFSLAGRTAWARSLTAPLRDYLNTETGGAVALLAATVAALVCANSPWSDSYDSVWGTELSIRVGDAAIAMDVRQWVNEGLMTFFFLVVGLEGKRELDVGQLRERRRLAALAVMSAIAMACAVGLYLAFNAGGDGAHGWAAAMSTDTAFVLGVLALVAPNGTRLRVRLLTMAVVDDLVALVVIATVYTQHVSLVALVGAGGLFAALVALRYAPVAWRTPAAIVLGAARRRLGDLAQRAAAVPAASVDELRDRALVRTRERWDPHRRSPHRGDGRLADHPRDRRRLRRGQAAGHGGRRGAGVAVAAARDRPRAELAGDRRRRRGQRPRLHRLAADLEHRLPRAGPRGGQARRARRGAHRHRRRLGGLPDHPGSPGRGPRPPDQRHGRRPGRCLRRRRSRPRPRPRRRRRGGDAGRVRRLRVPVLRTGRGRH